MKSQITSGTAFGVSMPAAHVLMPMCNTAKYLESAIQSVLAQTYPELKLIIINDGSTDQSLAIAQDYQQKNPEKIILIDVKAHRGVTKIRQELIAYSQNLNKNAYIFWLDSDDKYTNSDFVRLAIDQMQKTKADICLFNFSVIFEEENQRINAAGLFKEKENVAQILRNIINAGNAVNPLSMPSTNILDFTSLGWAKAYAPEIKWPTPEDCPFQDFVYMSILLQVKKITALPAELEPIQYLRRSTSIGGQRKSENFTHDIPSQLKRFFETVLQESTNSAKDEQLQKLQMAHAFVTRKFKQYEEIISNLINQSYNDINKKTLEDFRQEINKVNGFITEELKKIQQKL